MLPQAQLSSFYTAGSDERRDVVLMQIPFSIRIFHFRFSDRDPIPSREPRPGSVRILYLILKDSSVFFYDPRGCNIFVVTGEQYAIQRQVFPDIRQSLPEHFRSDSPSPGRLAYPVPYISAELKQRIGQLVPNAHFSPKLRFIRQPKVGGGNPSLGQFFPLLKVLPFCEELFSRQIQKWICRWRNARTVLFARFYLA